MKLPQWADRTCRIRFTLESKEALSVGKLKFQLIKDGVKNKLSGLDFTVDAIAGKIKLFVADNNSTIKLGRITGNYEIHLWRKSVLTIKNQTTCNDARLICDNSEIVIGEDCLLSDQIVFQSNDQHGIIDLNTNEIVNDTHKTILVGDHVWIGRRVNLLHGTKIGSGSIVGLGSLVNKKFKKNSLVAGVPAKTIKDDVTWSRQTSSIDNYATKIMSDFRKNK